MTGGPHSANMRTFFLTGTAGRLFAVYFTAADVAHPNRGVLYFPPFAEESNKARRMAVLFARRVASQGYAVLLIDPYGTGDSEGEFVNVRWDIWRDDLQRAARWMQEHGCERLSFWGLRLGAILAMELAESGNFPVRNLLLWQPVIRGELFLTQFLRIRMAADIASRSAPVTTKQMRDQLRNGHALEIGGYWLTPEMARAMDAAVFPSRYPNSSIKLDWFEVGAAGSALSAVASRQLEAWQFGDTINVAHTVAGEPFWLTPEITIVPELLDRSVRLITDDSA